MSTATGEGLSSPRRMRTESSEGSKMELTDEQLRRLHDWFDAKSVRAECPSCGWTSWTPGRVVVMPFSGKDGKGTNEGLPVVPVLCNNCGYVRLFLGRRMGVVGGER